MAKIYLGYLFASKLVSMAMYIILGTFLLNLMTSQKEIS